MVETPHRERTVFDPFGPVDNGARCRYGLDVGTELLAHIQVGEAGVSPASS